MVEDDRHSDVCMLQEDAMGESGREEEEEDSGYDSMEVECKVVVEDGDQTQEAIKPPSHGEGPCDQLQHRTEPLSVGSPARVDVSAASTVVCT